jgi:hypothetical protein
MSNTFNFYYYGMSVKLSSDNVFFADLLKQKFIGFTKNSNSEQISNKNVSIKFNSVTKFTNYNLEQKLSDHTSISHDKKRVLFSNYYLDAKFCTYIEINDGLNIDIEYKPSYKFLLLNIISRNLLRRQLFQNIIKTEIEQNLLHVIATKNNMKCLHASAVEKNGEVFIFAGLNGVGKSTLSQFLVKNHGYSFFGDNYILIDSMYSYKSPDVVRLSKKSIDFLDDQAISNFGFKKRVVKTLNYSSRTKVRTASIFLVTQGKKYSLSISKDPLITKTLHYQSLENENVENSKLAYLFSPINDRKFLISNNIKQYELVLSNFEDLEKLANEL